MIEVRTIREDEVPAYVAALATGFHQHAAAGEGEFRRPQIDLDRTYGAFDGPCMVGTARSFRTELTVPGGAALPVAAVTNVTVTGTHRRRGVLRSMMGSQLGDVAARGEPAAILVASEAPIYGRFGYGPATEHLLVEVDLTVGRMDVPEPPGSTRLCSTEETHALAPAVYERYRSAQPGAIHRDARWWDIRLGLLRPPWRQDPAQDFFVVHRGGDGDVDGYARYRIEPHWDYRLPRSVLDLPELVAVTDDAYVALWRHCTGLDLVRTVRAEHRPPLEPLPWLMSDRRAVTQVKRADLLWVRLLDVAAALAARRYRVEGSLVLEVADRFCPERGVRVALEGGPDGAACRPTTGSADLTVDVADLGASYLGGTPLWPAAAAGQVTEHRPGAVAAFDQLFVSDRPPWCCTWF